MSDILIDEPAVGGPPGSGPDGNTVFDADDAGERKRLYRWGAILLVAGLALLVFGLVASAIIMGVRVPAVLVGLVGVYMGLRRIGLAKFGGDFDLTFVLSGVWLTLLILAAVIAPLLPLGEYRDTTKTLGEKGYAPPSLFSDHPLGTNNFGLDLLARCIYGARASLIVAVAAVIIGILIGGILGICAGYFRGKTDAVIGVFTNSLLAVPALILLIALGSVLEPNLRNIAFALALLAIPSMIRIARANTIAFASREFVLAARAMGATRWRVMLRELAPNVALPLLSLGMVMISVLIVAEASLSFLGLGIKPPDPTWGNMIAEGQGGVFEQHPFIVLVPGVFLFLTVFAFNIVGEKAQKATAGGTGVKL